MSMSGTASSTKAAATLSKVRTSKAKFAACGRATASTSRSPARASSRIMSSARSAACFRPAPRRSRFPRTHAGGGAGAVRGPARLAGCAAPHWPGRAVGDADASNRGHVARRRSATSGLDTPATKVIVRGEPIAAPAGRADDFAWPRRGAAPPGTDPVATHDHATRCPVVQPPPPAAAAAPITPGARPGATADAPPPGRRASASSSAPAAAPKLRFLVAASGADRAGALSAAAWSFPSGTCRPRARIGGLRGSPRRPAIGRGACRRRRTPWRSSVR